MTFSGLAITYRLVIYALVAIATIAGLIAFGNLPQAVYPNLNIYRVAVRAESADLAPSLVQASLTRPLERELQSVLGVVQLRALSTQGAADIDVTFDPHVSDATVALQRVSTAVDGIRSSLPANTTIRIDQVGTNLFPVLSYALTSDRLSLMQLREAAEYEIKPQLLGTPGVSIVSVLGGDVREYHVDVDPALLAARGVSLSQVREAIAKTNTIEVIGHSDDAYVRSTMLASGLAHDANELAAIPVAVKSGVPISVGEVARVHEAPAPSIIRAGVPGRAAVLLDVFAQPGASFTGVASRVRERLREALAAIPGVTVRTYYDPASLVASAIASLRDAIIVGFVLSALVLLYFLRTWRSVIVAGAVIPLTIVISFGFMRLLGQGLNLMTLGGLAIGVGLIIDDAIVVVENIDRHFRIVGDRRQAVERAAAEIAAPMTTSTLTTIVVFAPLALLSGVPGAFFRALSITLTVALLLSLALAFTFTPNLAFSILTPAAEAERRIVERPLRFYRELLGTALSRRRLMWTGAGAVMLATVVLGLSLGTDFLPALDEGAFEMTYLLPPGTTLAETRRVTSEIERILQSDPAIRSSADLTGHSMTLENTDTPQGQNGATIRAILVQRGQRAPIRDVIERLQDRIQAAVPDIQLSTRQSLSDMLSDLSNELAPIELHVFGPNESVLIPIATQIAQRIARVPGVSGAFSGVLFHNPSLVMRERDSALSLGVTPDAFRQDEETMFDGTVVSTVARNPFTIPVRVRYDLPFDPSYAQVASAPYVTPSGAVEPLSRIATIERAPPQSDITELDGRQYLAVTAQTTRSNLGAIVAGIKRELASLTLPPGYSVRIAGSYALEKRSFLEFAQTLLFSMLLVFLVMLAQFRSLVQPLVILAAIPLSLFGAGLFLFLARITLNVSSFMGLILLVGLVVKNGILLLEYALRGERRGLALEEAIASAAEVRFRPIVMTTLTALLGMLPLAFAFGAGSEILQPLAIAVIGGLSFSTGVTLIMVPVFYATFRPQKPIRDSAFALGGAIEEPAPYR
jgi:CzcA family heavy metal efflux pump